MSAVATLQDQVVAYVRSRFTPQEVYEVKPYGGEFAEAEIGAKAFTCPAIFIAVLGWHPEPHGRRLSGKGVRNVYLAAFVMTKAADREQRARSCLELSEQLAECLRDWLPDCTQLTATLTGLDEEAECENLYSRSLDDKGIARWMVKWSQCVQAKTRRTTPTVYPLHAVEIKDTVRAHVGTESAPGGDLVITEEVSFVQVDPAA